MKKSRKITLVTIIFIILCFALFSCNVYSVDSNKLDTLDLLDKGTKKFTKKFTLGHFKGNAPYIIGILNPENQIYIRYPLIIKPIECTSQGDGVKRVSSYTEVIEYFSDKSETTEFIVEEYTDLPYECGLFYIRYPWNKNGKIYSMIQKILIDKSKVNYNLSTSRLVDLKDKITPELERIIDNISKRIPGFYLGRYDIKYSSLEDLQAGKFKIIELNGVIAENLSVRVGNNLTLITGIIKMIILRVVIGMYNILNVNNYPMLLNERIKELLVITKCGLYRWGFLMIAVYLLIIFFII